MAGIRKSRAEVQKRWFYVVNSRGRFLTDSGAGGNAGYGQYTSDIGKAARYVNRYEAEALLMESEHVVEFVTLSIRKDYRPII